ERAGEQEPSHGPKLPGRRRRLQPKRQTAPGLFQQPSWLPVRWASLPQSVRVRLRRNRGLRTPGPLKPESLDSRDGLLPESRSTLQGATSPNEPPPLQPLPSPV